MSMTESAPTVALQGAGEQMAPTVGTNEAGKPEASAGTEATADAAEAQPMGEAQVEAEGETEDVDAELEAMKLRLQEMERASMGMKDGAADTTPAAAADAGAAGTGGAGGAAAAAASAAATTRSPSAALGAHVAVDAEEAIADADSRSIYVGNVDYSATVEELGAYFADCGTINRVTIMCNKHTGQPKGFAYIEFEDQVAVKNAMILNDSQFRARQLKVVPKRTNVPGVSRGGYRGRPRFARGSRGIGYGRRARRGLRGRWSPY